MNFLKKFFNFKKGPEEESLIFNPDNPGSVLEKTPHDPESSEEAFGSGAPEASGQDETEKEIERTRSEIKAEKFEKKVENLEDFLDCLKWSYDSAEKEDDRRKIGHQIMKIEIGLKSVGLDPEQISVHRMEDGTLGTYDPGNKEIAASADMLADFESGSELFRLVFKHEEMHMKGGAGGSELLAEGLTQVRTERALGMQSSFYDAEAAQAGKTFKLVGVEKACSLYDMKNPERLARYYFEIELEQLWKKDGGGLKKHFAEMAAKNKGRKTLYSIIQSLRKEGEIETRIEDFMAATENLYERIGDAGVKMIITDKLKELVEEK